MIYLKIVTLLSYALATYDRARDRTMGKESSPRGLITVLIGLLAQSWLLYAALETAGPESVFQLRAAIVLSAVMLALSGLGVELATGEKFFSIIILPVSAVMTIVSPLTETTLMGGQFSGGWFLLHVILALTGKSFFLLSALSAAVYLFSVRKLKAKNRLRAMFFFPPLARLESLTLWFVGLGVFFFCFGLLIGLAWSYTLFGGLFLTDPKRLAAITTGALHAIIFRLRFSGDISGPRFAQLAIFGFCLSLITTFGTSSHSHWYPGG